MNSLKRITCRRLPRNLANRLRSTAAASQLSSEIQIPKRIDRGPTDILKALESTVPKEVMAPHYKYQDDPFLIPQSKQQSRLYALSKESGKRTAIWVRQTHADLFGHRVADPIVPAFLPTPTYTEKDQVTEDVLLEVIRRGDVSNALQVYSLLEENVSIKVKQSLLELLCFYNNNEGAWLPEYSDERWHQQTHTKSTNNWQEKDEINKLFDFLTKQGGDVAAAAYNALICGTAKFNAGRKTFQLYTHCKENDVPLNVTAYNSVIKSIGHLKESPEKIINEIMDLYREMNKHGIHPNVGTVNATLKVISRSFDQTVSPFMGRILREFKKLGVQLSLASYHYILRLTATDRGSLFDVKTTLIAILEVLEQTMPEIKDAEDVLFFPYAMATASQNLCDLEIGERIHKLLMSGDNYKFISDSYQESIYYRNYFLLRLQMDTFEKFQEFYYKMVPNVYIPEPSILREILKVYQVFITEENSDFLRKLWSHIVIFGHLEREILVGDILSIMKKYSIPALYKHNATAAATVWKHRQEGSRKHSQRVLWNGSILGDIAVLLLRGDQFEEMLTILNVINGDDIVISETLDKTSINELLEGCILQGHTKGALLLVRYAVNAQLEDAELMARKVYKSLPLSPSEEKSLIDLVGKDILEIELSNNT